VLRSSRLILFDICNHVVLSLGDISLLVFCGLFYLFSKSVVLQISKILICYGKVVMVLEGLVEILSLKSEKDQIFFFNESNNKKFEGIQDLGGNLQVILDQLNKNKGIIESQKK